MEIAAKEQRNTHFKAKKKRRGGGEQACSTDPWQIASAAILIHWSRARHFPKGHLKKRKWTPRTYTNKHHSSALLATTCEREGQQFTKALQHTFTFLIKLTPMILVTAYLSNNRNTQKNKIINRSTHKKKKLLKSLHTTYITPVSNYTNSYRSPFHCANIVAKKLRFLNILKPNGDATSWGTCFHFFDRCKSRNANVKCTFYHCSRNQFFKLLSTTAWEQQSLFFNFSCVLEFPVSFTIGTAQLLDRRLGHIPALWHQGQVPSCWALVAISAFQR